MGVCTAVTLVARVMGILATVTLVVGLSALCIAARRKGTAQQSQPGRISPGICGGSAVGIRRVRHDRLVPRISEFYGIVIEMYFADHPPPHFHARYSGEEPLIVIETGEVFAGFVPGRALRLIREWLEDNRDELVPNWDRARAQQPTEPVAPIEMRELIKIDTVEPLEGSWLRLTFSDDAVKDVDIGEVLARGGVFEPIRQRRELFEQVRVNPETRTIEWPGEVDLDPAVLYGRFEPGSGVRLSRRTVREPSASRA